MQLIYVYDGMFAKKIEVCRIYGSFTGIFKRILLHYDLRMKNRLSYILMENLSAIYVYFSD